MAAAAVDGEGRARCWVAADKPCIAKARRWDRIRHDAKPDPPGTCVGVWILKQREVTAGYFAACVDGVSRDASTTWALAATNTFKGGPKIISRLFFF